MKVFIISLMVLFSFVNASVLKGKIDRYTVLMLLDEDRKIYSYKGHLVGIKLISKGDKKLCEYKLGEEEEQEVTACFYGELKEKTFSGVWRKLGSKKGLKFNLKVLTPPKSKNKYAETYTSEEFYYDLVEKGIKFKDIKKIKKIKSLKTTAKLELVTQIKRARVVLKNKNVQNKINAYLDNLHKEEVIKQIYCIDGVEYLTTKDMLDEIGDDMEVEYNKKPFLLLSYSGSISCEGAHPNNYYDQYLFDINSGKEIDLVSMFNIYDVKRENTNPKFKELISRYLEEDAKDCYDKNANYQSFALYPAKGKKLKVRLQGMGHAMFACESEPIAYIPIKELKPLAKNKAFDYFDFKPFYKR